MIFIFLQDTHDSGSKLSEASTKLKCILDQLKEYQWALDNRHNILLECIEFFSFCNSANTKLSNMEKQVLNLDKYITNTGSNLSPLESTIHQLEQILMDVLGKGNTLICHIGDKTESSLCIKDTMMQIENRVNSLRASCQLKMSEVILAHTSRCIPLFS